MPAVRSSVRLTKESAVGAVVAFIKQQEDTTIFHSDLECLRDCVRDEEAGTVTYKFSCSLTGRSYEVVRRSCKSPEVRIVI